MTGAQTDPVWIPRWQTASTIITQLAKRLFDVAQRSPVETPRAAVAFDSWYAMRAMNDRIQREHTLMLNKQNCDDLREALDLIHDLSHDGDMNPVVDVLSCKCDTADRIQALILTLSEDELERAGHVDRRLVMPA